MSKKTKIVGLALLILGITAAAVYYYMTHDIVLLEPAGTIADQQRDLMNIAGLLSLIIIVPVFFLTFFIAWKYRAGNHKAKHSPDWDHNIWLESLWWAIPCIIIVILAVITWKSTHALDPYRQLDSAKKPVTIEVVALQWKWLFIYPEQNIATVNYVQFPEKTPVNFKITADAPMNSFWIPKLGGQVYAMSGMTTKLHLMADGTGVYRGSSANLSGKGFANMRFMAKSTSARDFDTWVADNQKSHPALTFEQYENLAKPSEKNPITYYASPEQNLYDRVIRKYMPEHGMGMGH
jgi:cytochrome o ubiquinol oxidase subunit 2